MSGAIRVADGATSVQTFRNRLFLVKDYWKFWHMQFDIEIRNQ